ncbi:glycosyltransferase [Mycobacterium sp.]|uniref:glycosyltransferase n=1 Tax=Mycobacterium sp. TaxID=1785 RepID=UPI003D0CE858
MSRLRHMAIVVPARNEEDHIASCLESIRASIGHLWHEYPCLSCDAVVILDRCADRTGALVTSYGYRSIDSNVGRVGAARHLGATDAMARSRDAGIPDHQVWLANTDADSTVPETWLATQFDLANAGFDVVIGTVTPAGLDPEVDLIWRQRHELTEGHHHVHGANLGLRASTYAQAGGFAAVSLHEDLDLVNRVKARTIRWMTTHRTNVTTSARTQSRVDGGFASYLSDLGSGDRS